MLKDNKSGPDSRSLVMLVDGVPTPNGAGSNQTLANLLSGFKGKLYYLEAVNAKQDNVPGRMKIEKILHPVSRFKRRSDRWGRLLDKWIIRKQLSFFYEMCVEQIRLPHPNDCVIFLCTTLSNRLVIGYRLLKAGYTVIPYFMDDWLSDKTYGWKAGLIQQITKDILEAAPCWLMISRQIEQTLRRRYSLEKKPCLVVHNPAPIFKRNDSYEIGRQVLAGEGKQIIYAGSIWPMHADALFSLSSAIHLLQNKGQTGLSLRIYTTEGHWSYNRNQLEGPGVTYGGWKSYADIQQILPSAWLLLCTASFDGKHKAYSDSSVQTKLTDYMAAGKPILFVGPSEAASGVFVEEWDIGFTVATQLPSDIAASLEAISRMDKAYDRKANNGAVLATTTFSKPVIQQKLYDFLEQYAMPAQVTGSSV